MQIAILETGAMMQTKPDSLKIIFNAGDCPVVYGDNNCDTGQHVIVEGEKSDLLAWFSQHRYVWVGSSNMMLQNFNAFRVNADGTALEGYDFTHRDICDEADAYVRYCEEQRRMFLECLSIIKQLDTIEHRNVQRTKRSPTVKLKHVKRTKR